MSFELNEEIIIKNEPFEEHYTQFDVNEADNETDNIDAKPFEIVQVKTESLSAEPLTCGKCNMNFSSSEDLEHHVNSVHKISFDYLKCSQCNATFMSQGRLDTHLRTHPNSKVEETPYVCVLCDKYYQRNESLKQHLKYCHSKFELFKCKFCNESFKLKSSLTEHLNIIHAREFDFKCSKCSKGFRTNRFLKQHERTHRKILENDQICTKCNEVFKSFESLKEHMKIEHKIVYFKCSICDAEFTSKFGLMSHIRIHTEHTCSICNYNYGQKRYLKIHLKNIHKLDDNSINKLVPENHKKNDSNVVKPYKCSICSRDYRYKSHLKYHLCKIHGINDKVVIQNLLKSQKNSFIGFKPKKLSRKTKNGRKPSICKICNINFSSTITLKYHIKSFHEGLEPFECSECASCFTQKHALISHINVVHCGIKPYKCSICNQEFKYTSQLRYHLSKIHGIDDKVVLQNLVRDGKIKKSEPHGNLKKNSYKDLGPYKCATCDKKFKSRNGLVGHVLAHCRMKPYKCSICSQDFGTGGHLRYHLRKTHEIDNMSVIQNLLCESKIQDAEPKPRGNVKKKEKIVCTDIVHDPFSCFKCDKCGLVANFENLEKHIAANHTEDSSFKCSVCKATFKSVQNLRRHLSNMHEKPSDVPQNVSEVSCDSINVKCKQDFNNVKCHFNKMHTNNKQLKCDLCGKTYRQKSTLRRHFVNFHKTASLTSGLQRSPPKHELRQSVVTNKVRQPDCKLTASSPPEMWITKVKPCYVRLDRGEVTRYLKDSEGLPPLPATPPVNPCVTSDLLLGPTLENVKQEENYFTSNSNVEPNFLVNDCNVNSSSSSSYSSKNFNESAHSESKQLKKFEEMYIKMEPIVEEVIVDPLSIINNG